MRRGEGGERAGGRAGRGRGGRMAPRAAQGTAHILVREALLGLEAGRLERVGVGRDHGISHVGLEEVIDGGGDVLLDG